MKRFATGILFVAGLIYVPARLYESVHPAMGFLRAFCEAAMIGGLADWFAVTALFRHPLGVPLPHTAIIPNNKERIADALARFVEFNFLSTEVVTEKLGKIDFTQLAASWMADPARSGPALAKIVEFLPRIFGMPGVEPLRRYAREHCTGVAAQADLLPAVSALLGGLATAPSCAHLADEIADLAERQFGRGEDEIQRALAAAATRLWPSLDVAAEPAQRLLSAVARALAALNNGTDARQRLASVLHDLLTALRDSPTLPARLAEVEQALMTTPAWSACMDTLWARLATRLHDDLRGPDSAFRTALQASVRGLGENLVGNMMVRMVLNMQIRQFLVGFVEQRRHHAAELIAETMRKWDAETMSGRVEDAIGRDLQYIRINGTLIGGLIGVVIHALSNLVPH